MESEIIRGTLVDGQIVDVRISPRGGEVGRVRDTADSLVMATEDGDHVKLRFDHTSHPAAPTRREGRFGDLLDDPLGLAVIERAPGDHVEVELEGTVIEQGDALTILGTVERRVPDDYRGEGEARPYLVRVECFASGHHDVLAPLTTSGEEQPAPSVPPESPPAKPQRPGLGLPLLFLAAGAGCVAAGLAGVIVLETPIMLWVAGLPLLALGLYGLRRRRAVPQWLELGKRHEGEGMDGAIGVLALAVPALVAFACLATLMSGASEADATTSAMAGGAALLVPAVLGGLTLYRDHAHATLILRLLRAPRLATLDTPSFGYLIGTLTEGTLERRREFTLTRTSREVLHTGSDGRVERRTEGGSSDSWVEMGTASKRVVVQTELGQIEVRGSDAHFGSLRREWERMNEQLDGHQTSTSSASRTKHSALLERAQPGDTVLLVGRPRDGSMQAAGPESLALFSAPPGEQPRPHLRRHVLAHFALVGALFALSVVGFVVRSNLASGS